MNETNKRKRTTNKSKSKTPIVFARCPQELVDRMNAIAKREERSFAFMARLAFKEFIARDAAGVAR